MQQPGREEATNIFSEECNKQIGDLARQIEEIQYEGQHRYESLQIEATRRHEGMQQEGAKCHQELIELLTSHTSHTREIEVSVMGAKEGQLHTYPNLSSSSLKRTDEEKGKGILPTPPRGYDTHEGSTNHTSPRTPYHILFPKFKFSIFDSEELRE